MLGLAIWTRLDSSVVAAAPLLWRHLRRGASAARDLVALLAPCAALTIMLVEANAPRPRWLAVMAGVWLGYVAFVGGDFMEFRFIVPVVPVLFAWIGRALAQQLRPRLALAIAGGVVLESGLHVYSTSDEIYEYDGAGTETVFGLERRLTDPALDWIGVGHALGRHFSDVPSTTIAVGAAGAILFNSKLRTIDSFGLNDAWVARHGVAVGRRPGHTRHAPLGYLVEQRVSFVVAAPPGPPTDRASVSRGEAVAYSPFGDIADLPADASIVEVPLDAGRVAPVLYLVKDPAVDARVARDALRVIAVR